MLMNQIDSKKAEQLATDYTNSIYERLIQKDPEEHEFHQAVKEILLSLIPVLAMHPKYKEYAILERLVEPERAISFRVPWVDDHGQVQVNRGYRLQFNSTIGPYKGGFRFHPTVNVSIMKFLAFEQIFKNALTGLPIGGGKGGADFDPKGKSDLEIMRFCQSFMTEVGKYLGEDTDVPAGDIGVGARELGYLYGQYKRMKGRAEAGVLTGKGVGYGGILGRKEATGYGLVYFVQEMLADQGDSFQNRVTVISGSGNVSIYAIEKATQLGAKVVACSDSNGYIYDEKGINIETVKQLKEVERKRISEYIKLHPHAVYIEGSEKIWSIPCEIALPCATQNELNLVAAEQLVNNGVKIVAEGANMPTTLEAMDYFIDHQVFFAPGKAANAGGVSISAIEMSQNSMRLPWTLEEVDAKLQSVMKHIYSQSMTAAKEYGYSDNLVIGANIAGFVKVADAMIEQGVV